MSEQDPNTLAGIRPRDGAWDRMAQTENERMKVAVQTQEELAKARAAMHAENGGMLNRSVSLVDAAALANAVAGMSQEVGAMARHMGRIDELVRSLLDSKSPFTDDDVAAIKAHVRHPGALEAAKLRETIRCALEALKLEQLGVAENILGGADAKQ